MANHKSAAKRHLQSEKRRERNRSLKSALNTQVKKARTEISAKASKPNDGQVKLAVVALAKAATKGLIHKRTAARRASRLMIQANVA